MLFVLLLVNSRQLLTERTSGFAFSQRGANTWFSSPTYQTYAQRSACLEFVAPAR